MPGEVIALAMFTVIAPPVHRLCTTQEDGLQGEALLSAQAIAVSCQETLVEAYQDIGDTFMRWRPRRMAAAGVAQRIEASATSGSIGRYTRYVRDSAPLRRGSGGCIGSWS